MMQHCAKIDDAASRRDADWFRLHPARTVRVRSLVPGELIPVSANGDGVQAVVVRQLRPGCRARVPVYLPRLPDDTEEAGIAILRRCLGVRS